MPNEIYPGGVFLAGDVHLEGQKQGSRCTNAVYGVGLCTPESPKYGGKVYKFNFIEGLCIPNSLKRSFQFHIE